MILHVTHLDKFVAPYIDFVNRRFGGGGHCFWVYESRADYQKPKGENVVYTSRTLSGTILGHLSLIALLHRSDAVILHGLFNIRVVVLLALMPWLIPKCYWVLWGGDYFHSKLANRDIRYHLKEPFRRFVMRRIGHLITFIPESVEIVRDWFGNRGTWHECLCYTSNVFHDAQPIAKQEGRADTRIMIGNSATPTNRHFDVFDVIAPYATDEVMIYVPLSYGDKTYAKSVIDRGIELFGDRFVPLTDFMPRDQYQELLKSLDVVFFNHNRHQAMGTLINILGLGKTVYMNTEVASWAFLKRLGAELFDIDEFNGFEARADSEKNRRIVKYYFSEEKLEEQWRAIFER